MVEVEEIEVVKAEVVLVRLMGAKLVAVFGVGKEVVKEDLVELVEIGLPVIRFCVHCCL